ARDGAAHESAVQMVGASGPGVCGVARGRPGSRHAGPVAGDPVSARRVVAPLPVDRGCRDMRLRADGVPPMAVVLSRAAV
ncbi:hypothetical protein, partial [Bifidobacterium adolescentis]|uniref:hypothetical protein n=1 Tax=Bifidobacterium adolescentis TaxID=1680 RepID=UPI0034A42B95